MNQAQAADDTQLTRAQGSDLDGAIAHRSQMLPLAAVPPRSSRRDISSALPSTR